MLITHLQYDEWLCVLDVINKVRRRESLCVYTAGFPLFQSHFFLFRSTRYLSWFPPFEALKHAFERAQLDCYICLKTLFLCRLYIQIQSCIKLLLINDSHAFFLFSTYLFFVFFKLILLFFHLYLSLPLYYLLCYLIICLFPPCPPSVSPAFYVFIALCNSAPYK